MPSDVRINGTAPTFGYLDAEEDYELDADPLNTAQFEATLIGMPLELSGPTLVRAEFRDTIGRLLWRHRADVRDWTAYRFNGERFGLLPGLPVGSSRLPLRGRIRVQAQGAYWHRGRANGGQPYNVSGYQGRDDPRFGSFVPDRLYLRLRGRLHCVDGSFGRGCASICPGGLGPLQCYRNGLCRDGVFGDGQCQCFSQWDPATNCSTCRTGFQGYNCQLPMGRLPKPDRYTSSPDPALINRPVTITVEGANLPQPPASGDLLKVVLRSKAPPATDCSVGDPIGGLVVRAGPATLPGARQGIVTIPFGALPSELIVCYSADGRMFLPVAPVSQALSAVDLDECASAHPCSPDADCHNTEGSFQCECRPGFEGDGIECYVAGCMEGNRPCMAWNSSLGRFPGTSCAMTYEQGALHPWCVESCANGECTVAACHPCNDWSFAQGFGKHMQAIWITLLVLLLLCVLGAALCYRRRQRQRRREQHQESSEFDEIGSRTQTAPTSPTSPASLFQGGAFVPAVMGQPLAMAAIDEEAGSVPYDAIPVAVGQPVGIHHNNPIDQHAISHLCDLGYSEEEAIAFLAAHDNQLELVLARIAEEWDGI